VETVVCGGRVRTRWRQDGAEGSVCSRTNPIVQCTAKVLPCGQVQECKAVSPHVRRDGQQPVSSGMEALDAFEARGLQKPPITPVRPACGHVPKVRQADDVTAAGRDAFRRFAVQWQRCCEARPMNGRCLGPRLALQMQPCGASPKLTSNSSCSVIWDQFAAQQLPYHDRDTRTGTSHPLCQSLAQQRQRGAGTPAAKVHTSS
jgi:hypothetical protein